MKIDWTVKDDHPKLLRTFLRTQGVSRQLLARLKSEKTIWINHVPAIVTTPIQAGDVVTIRIPEGAANTRLVPSDNPLDILYEDDTCLIVNKPHSVASVPSPNHPVDTMVNRVVHYIQTQQYLHQTVHVVTRLDRDTSGAMVFAKNGFIHALLDQQLRDKTLHKAYVAVVEGKIDKSHDMLRYPIGHSEQSIIERVVDYSDQGKQATTEYWLQASNQAMSLVNIKLWTGRTHQIRVHFFHIGHPLVGDDLYGGSKMHINRQALHCQCIQFKHPLTHKMITVEAAIPEDMNRLIESALL